MNYKILFFIALMFLPVSLFAAAKIDINSATLEQLDGLSGIGPKYAQSIIEGRPYSAINELLGIKGIGEKTLEKIKAQGLACVDCVFLPDLTIEASPGTPNTAKDSPKSSFYIVYAVIIAIVSGGIIFSLKKLAIIDKS